ncbi:hypothetical protein F3Y22_tig00000483pilonHSYRG00019 [Hibiscus syriacus]|uniref:Uncharacterized protein n=1 Tax=Hibiscus syriacus TaxID=106335 RepID=A0A6A3D0R7_HIBSY|nr:uncharacterized protein LOC120207667 isoform X2 [Hibiscus syriacus]KAE8735026.1 hypothetical protein F3Y22_tig00000483pilonHSYRG00019 [Hibiscus syriacus]
MKLALLRNMSFLGCRFLQSSAKSNTFLPLPKQPSYFSLAALIRSQPRFYSTNGGGGDDDDDVSKEELKMRIKKFFDGDDEAIPSIFEGILKRKLTGKHDESDDELMREICGDWKQPLDNAVDQEELDSDLSDSSDTDRD